jgi:hypothetical protein
MDGVESASSEMATTLGRRRLEKLDWASVPSALLLALGVALTLAWAGFWVWLLVELL